MSRINVLVAYTSKDVEAEIIAECVSARSDMSLIKKSCVAISEVDRILDSIPSTPQCAIVVVGRHTHIDELAQRWLAQRSDVVVLHLDLAGDFVRITLRDPRLESLLTALVGLVERVGVTGRERFARIQLLPSEHEHRSRPLLRACIEWVHALLRNAVTNAPDDNGDMHGLSVTARTLVQSLDANLERMPGDMQQDVIRAGVALDLARGEAIAETEPLAAAAQVFGLGPLEFRLMVLALAPELDLRFQRCFGFLLDDMSRRVGTRALFHSLLHVAPGDVTDVTLVRWLIHEENGGRPPSADESLKIDPFLAQWLLGDRQAFAKDPAVRLMVRSQPWAGAELLERHEEKTTAAVLMDRLRDVGAAQWIVLGGGYPAVARALLERGARDVGAMPIRVELAHLEDASLDSNAIEDCAFRIGRMAGLNGDPLAIDLITADGSDMQGDRVRLFLAAVARTGCRAALIVREEARAAHLLGDMRFELLTESAFSMAARAAAVRAAAAGADTFVSEEAAREMAGRFPLPLDALEEAMHLARSRPRKYDDENPPLARFIAACKEVAAEGLSNLTERIEPVFDISDVVLPLDRQEQLTEIVDNIRLAPRVLDEWKFRDQLPYGRGVTALFFGPSGTGKTMAAIGIAKRLGIQLLRLELSRVVSKYIGDTEKSIDRVFSEAQRSGSAILIDEADALLGKRSEVKDAHDRYANIEVAYLLQRMEAYEGLAILTTNMRQNLDPAFLRRLRFIIDFPRPDVAARERIWRQCLPDQSHSLTDAAFTQLARKIDLTGGNIRQITLRAAFIAAAADEQIGLEHIAQAARAEFAKLGMPPVALDLSQTRRAA